MRSSVSLDTDVIAMADFQTHITTSTVLGIAGGLAAHAFYEVPLPSCILAGGLCSVAGMLPDLDSDSGVPLRESVAFAAAIIPMMLLERFAKWGFGFEATILVSAMLYLVVRFGFAEALKNYTVHRGMFHSIPAALIAAELTFLIFDNENVALRFLNAGAVFTGYMSHLILDELWSVDVNWGLVRFKSSFGNAVKFWGDNAWANFTTYGKLVVLTLLMTRDPAWNNVVEPWMTGRPILNQDKAWAQQLANWRQLYFQKEYGAIPPNAVDHPLNPWHAQALFNGGVLPFAQQVPNYYPQPAHDPARPLTSGSAYQGYHGAPSNYTGYPLYSNPQHTIQPQSYNPALPLTSGSGYNLARLPDTYQAHAPSAFSNPASTTMSPYQQNPLTNSPYQSTSPYQSIPSTTPYQSTSPYQVNPLSPSRPSMNPQNWQLPHNTPSTNALQYQSSSAPTNPWVAQDWSTGANFTQLGNGLNPNYQNGMTSVSHSYGGYDSNARYNNANSYPSTNSWSSPWSTTPTNNYSPRYNTVQPNSNGLDRFPSLQR
jgi:membrane-bound metal-dependent hydrolase YbcI (DUF457 family)